MRKFVSRSTWRKQVLGTLFVLVFVWAAQEAALYDREQVTGKAIDLFPERSQRGEETSRGGAIQFNAQQYRCPARRRHIDDVSGIFFMRIPKTGSSSAKTAFKGLSQNSEFTYHYQDNCYHCSGWHKRTDDHIQTMHDLHVNGSFIFTGHSHFIPRALLPSNIFLVSLVRQPILRQRSEYQYFWPRKRVGAFSSCLCTNSTTFEECVMIAPPECYEKVLGLGHTYVSFFCGHEDVCMSEPESEAAFLKAVRNLDELDLIGLTEDLAAFFADVAGMIPGLEHVDWAIPHEKKTKKGHLSRAALDKILTYNNASNELKLYREIRRRYCWRRGFCGHFEGLHDEGLLEDEIQLLGGLF